jgi:hypothetical protein
MKIRNATILTRQNSIPLEIIVSFKNLLHFYEQTWQILATSHQATKETIIVRKPSFFYGAATLGNKFSIKHFTRQCLMCYTIYER